MDEHGDTAGGDQHDGQVVTLDHGRRGNGGGKLTPFVKGDGRAVEAGRRSAESRRAKRLAERATVDTLASDLRALASTFQRGDLGPVALGAALDMIGRVQRGEVSVRDPAEWVRVLVDVARLEAGDPTSASVVLHASAIDRVRQLQREAAALGPAPSSSALAADDVDSPEA